MHNVPRLWGEQMNGFSSVKLRYSSSSSSLSQNEKKSVVARRMPRPCQACPAGLILLRTFMLPRSNLLTTHAQKSQLAVRGVSGTQSDYASESPAVIPRIYACILRPGEWGRGGGKIEEGQHGGI